MAIKIIKRRDGFEGEKLISLPESLWRDAIKKKPAIGHLYITHIGYFPKAAYHYRERRNGCTDNILIYCIRGKGWYMIGGKRYEVGVNQFFIIPATKEHIRYGADETDPWTIFWTHFSGNNMKEFNRSFGIDLLDGPQPIILNEEGLELWEIMYKNFETGYSLENLSKNSLRLHHFVGTFLFPDKYVDEKKQEATDLISETIVFMRTKLADKITVDELAVKNNLSTSHFTVLFRKVTGMSPMDYFIHLKLQKACLLLSTTNIKIKKLAGDLGYPDAFYFSRLFKKYIYVSPEQYRFSRRNNIKDQNLVNTII